MMSKPGSVKEIGSIRSLGLTYIAVDKPLRAVLKSQAAARGLTMIEHIRQLASQAAAKPVQTSQDKEEWRYRGAPGYPASQSDIALVRVVENLANFLTVKVADSITFVGDTQQDLDRHIALLAKLTNTEYAQSRLADAKALLAVKQAQIEQSEQARMEFKFNEGLADA